MGAAGRDFHNFNVFFKDNPDYEVKLFTATQIPDIAGRVYPPELAGSSYPAGIPIMPEEGLTDYIRQYDIIDVHFSYSDVSHEYVMHRASDVLAAGASFTILGPRATMLKSRKPVVAVCATRTGAGKSQTTRKVASILKGQGRRVVIVRHPMPYGNLLDQACQRFGSLEDLERFKCTVEEREEYEPHIEKGMPVYSGVDYERILRSAEEECDILVWDGGNNDMPFYFPNLLIVVVDSLRPGHELTYHPGESNLRAAHVVIINKVDTASGNDVDLVRDNVMSVNPGAVIIEAASPIYIDDDKALLGRRVLVIEDGPTLTHGGMRFGAGVIAAKRFGASETVDPRPYLAEGLKWVFEKYPHIGALLPAMGYGASQLSDLESTINATSCDVVVIATPIDLSRLIRIDRPTVRVRYELQEIGYPTLKDALEGFPKTE
jgi:predicted GTPase